MKKKKIKPITFSKRADAFYRKRLSLFIKAMIDNVIAGMRKARLTDSDNEDYINELIQSISELAGANIDEFAKNLTIDFIKKVDYQNKAQFNKEMIDVFGVNVENMIKEKGIQEVISSAITENVNLIKSIKNDFVSDIGSHVFEAFKNGDRHKSIIDLIRERGDVSINRAKFIARDQSSKLNADFTKARRQALGIDEYKWRGAEDSRERHSHNVLNNMICKYSDPTVYSDDNGKTWKKRKSIGGYIGDVGTDYQCRCVGLVVIRDS